MYSQKRSRQKERNTIDLSETDPEAQSDKPLQPNGPKAEVKAEPVTGSVKRRGRPVKKSLSLPKVLDRSESEDKRPVAGKKRSRSSAVGLPSKRPKISGDPEGLGDPDSTDVPKKDNDLTGDEGPKILQESHQVCCPCLSKIQIPDYEVVFGAKIERSNEGLFWGRRTRQLNQLHVRR